MGFPAARSPFRTFKLRDSGKRGVWLDPGWSEWPIRSMLTVIGTVAARDQLLVLSLHGEPCLEVVLDRSGIVQSSRNDLRDSVGETERLVERLGVFEHVLEHGRGVFRLGDAELLNLLELMHSEDTPSIPSVGTGFLSETGRVSGVPAIDGDWSGSKSYICLPAVAHLMGSSLGSIRSSACMAEIGCSEVAMRYLSSSPPPTCSPGKALVRRSCSQFPFEPRDIRGRVLRRIDPIEQSWPSYPSSS